ncbi:hypothetical protein K402DRAFT_436996, partial [Aulographum hederae CBS 113979]
GIFLPFASLQHSHTTPVSKSKLSIRPSGVEHPTLHLTTKLLHLYPQQSFLKMTAERDEELERQAVDATRAFEEVVKSSNLRSEKMLDILKNYALGPTPTSVFASEVALAQLVQLDSQVNEAHLKVNASYEADMALPIPSGRQTQTYDWRVLWRRISPVERGNGKDQCDGSGMGKHIAGHRSQYPEGLVEEVHRVGGRR